MRIIYDPVFETHLFKIIDYIAADKPIAAHQFAESLKKSIENLPHYPFKYRKSIYFDDENIRDMIFKGYTIVYKIYPQENSIYVLDIFNRNKR